MKMDIFKNGKIFLPVVHVGNVLQTIKQVHIALCNGADGVFLINHSVNSKFLFNIYNKVRKVFDTWIGINCLGLSPIDVIIHMPNDVDGLWVDNAQIDEECGIDSQVYAYSVLDAIKKKGWEGLYFGGVAFKYQKEVKDYVKTTNIASTYMDVITTSGIGTGIAADVKKIDVMAEVAHHNGKKLGIASGITPDNINSYRCVDAFLVSTGISKSFGGFDRTLVKKLSNRISAFNNGMVLRSGRI